MDTVVLSMANVLWDYLLLKQPLSKSDCILVFGGHDISVAIHAAYLFKQKWAEHIIVSGGVTHPAYYYGLEKDCIEAEALSAVLIREGVDKQSIILERKARNTSENFWFTNDLISERGLFFSKFILVQKPYTERRTFLTGKNRWPDKEIIVSSINTTFYKYMNGNIEPERIINMMTGEIFRICEYPKLGYFKKQEIPDRVMEAYNFLVSKGYSMRINK